MSQFITCDFLGRFGNNLFQVAAMIGYCQKHGVEYGIPKHYHHREIYRHWKLPLYRGNAAKLPVYDDTAITRFTYKELPKFDRPTKLRGFFQSEQYFKFAESAIRDTFRLNIDPIDRIGIHVRRGDYVQHEGLFLPTSEEDVMKAVIFFKSIGFDKFLVCSDDIRWCKKVFSSVQTDIKFNEDTDYFQDMSMLASCRGNLVSRSSFSWWAAWLNPHHDKVIASLTPWFGPKNQLNSKDIVPKEWIKLI